MLRPGGRGGVAGEVGSWLLRDPKPPSSDKMLTTSALTHGGFLAGLGTFGATAYQDKPKTVPFVLLCMIPVALGIVMVVLTRVEMLRKLREATQRLLPEAADAARLATLPSSEVWARAYGKGFSRGI